MLTLEKNFTKLSTVIFLSLIITLVFIAMYLKIVHKTTIPQIIETIKK